MRITFLGAGSTIFAKNVLGDCILTKELKEFEIALYDIDEERMNDSYIMLSKINKKYQGLAIINKYTDRMDALRGARYVINAIQVGGYKPCTVMDFEIPLKYGLKQTIGDTLGVAGIFRALRTIPVLDSIAADMKSVCPNALFINYANPMGILTGYLINHLKINSIGLCHSVQVCAKGLLETLEMEEFIDTCKWKIAGINHQAWLLEITDKYGNDLYPEIKKRSLDKSGKYNKDWDLVRHDIMQRFGYYLTESSEHSAEYTPWYIKNSHPDLIEKYNIPLNEYPRRCEKQITDWNNLKEDLVDSDDIVHEKSYEYAANIIKAIETKGAYRVHGNVINTNLITNLPVECCVEVPCLIDENGVNPIYVGEIPEALAAINRTNINVQTLAIQAAISKKREDVYKAAYLDPHTSSELSLEEIKDLCDDMIKAQKDWLDIE